MLSFVRRWGGYSSKREYAWSGTPYSILMSLKKFCTVHESDIEYDYFTDLSLKFLNKTTSLFGRNLFSIPNIYIEQKKIDSLKIEEDSPILVFGEYNCKYTKNSYVYQDMTVDYLARLKKNAPEILQYTNFNPKISDNALRHRVSKANLFYENCAGIFTMSDWLRNDLIKNTGIEERKVHSIGAGANVDFSMVDSSHSHKMGNKFLFVGKDWDRKNGSLVVEAFLKLKQKYSSIELYIAGPSEKPLGVENASINYLGRLNYKELAYYYNMCDFFVMPSKFEAYGIVFAEALIYGLPCIGMNRYAMPEFINPGKNGLLIENEDADELAAAMQELYIHGANFKTYLLDYRYYYANKYSWDSVANKMIETFREDGYQV